MGLTKGIMNRILIIEDSKSTAEQLKFFLEQEGYIVSIAANGLEGIKLFEASIFDLVITDILMPVMDGIEVILFLKKNYPKIKIIAMTSGGNIKAAEYLKAVKLLGVDFTLRKPFRDNYLKNILNKIIENKFSFETGLYNKVR
jgi:CheY-like chemotaxis protein